MRDEDFDEAIDNADGGIRTAVDAWDADPATAKGWCGPIASWDTSGITNMRDLFYEMEDFNEDISSWNVSNVVNMDCMFVRWRHLVHPPAQRGVVHQHGHQELHVRQQPRHHRGEGERRGWHHRVSGASGSGVCVAQ